MTTAVRPSRSQAYLLSLLAVAGLVVSLGYIPGAQAEPEASPLPSSKASDRKELAEARYRVGVESFRQRRYREAADYFEQADELYPSAAYSYNVALALDKIGDTGGALHAYRQYLRRRLAAPNAATVLQRINALEQALAEQGLRQLTISSEPIGAAVSIDGAAVGNTPWTSEIAPGRHRIRISLKGYAPLVRMVDLASTRARDLDFRLARTTEASPAPAPAKARTAPKSNASGTVRRDYAL
jgi:tetratricopeptide (TPR) repeat protein